MTLRVSLAQITSSSDPNANLATVEKQVAAAADAGSRLVVFPEATMHRFGTPLGDVAQPLDGPWADAVRDCAARAGITVVAGMFTPSDNGRVRNTLLVTGGGVDSHYDKIHLFDAFGFAESDTVAPGTEPLVVTVDGVGIGLATCYDLRFPGLFQTLADRGAALTVVAASWGAGPGKVDQWTLLARARALDSTTFIAACDQADPVASGEEVHGTAPLGVGNSIVVSPTGTVLGHLDSAPGLLTVDIDTDTVAKVRETLPVLANRRF
ncbi:carbon-nitrogen hydrolase family protein [Antrihabitans cavernicola]|uniref:Carbon-nitrogen hydrolase family protein n=1 Tax=Antrihabitans cavernicola TaxID=2495913 RepID=A0A5A7SAX6_9NOCA|nr:carbon-nitrogen hydrolase family protein [Spelaeibacter cavernicola]KAA0022312.1 carbon-nitrogen hydrolase family protein [Spelaeibacter cavernicola]